jgi:nucleotide-binding universal stress UspA family protein
MFKNILVATDFSDTSKSAVSCARELGARLGSTLHLMHVVLDPASQPWSAEAFAMPLDDLILQWQEHHRRHLSTSQCRRIRERPLGYGHEARRAAPLR